MSVTSERENFSDTDTVSSCEYDDDDENSLLSDDDNYEVKRNYNKGKGEKEVGESMRDFRKRIEREDDQERLKKNPITSILFNSPLMKGEYEILRCGLSGVDGYEWVDPDAATFDERDSDWARLVKLSGKCVHSLEGSYGYYSLIFLVCKEMIVDNAFPDGCVHETVTRVDNHGMRCLDCFQCLKTHKVSSKHILTSFNTLVENLGRKIDISKYVDTLTLDFKLLEKGFRDEENESSDLKVKRFYNTNYVLVDLLKRQGISVGEKEGIRILKSIPKWREEYESLRDHTVTCVGWCVENHTRCYDRDLEMSKSGSEEYRKEFYHAWGRLVDGQWVTLDKIWEEEERVKKEIHEKEERERRRKDEDERREMETRDARIRLVEWLTSGRNGPRPQGHIGWGGMGRQVNATCRENGEGEIFTNEQIESPFVMDYMPPRPKTPERRKSPKYTYALTKEVDTTKKWDMLSFTR